jgi:excinuclease ABC subunit A
MGNELILRGVRENNLRGFTLHLPHDRVIAITGLSGSGKSSLAFDTIFAEGQWRYVESLSPYVRLFLDKRNRPDVEGMENVRPSIALEQRNPVRTARSTVATATELADYLRLLFAKVGTVHCPECGEAGVTSSPTAAGQALLREHAGARAVVLFPQRLAPERAWAEQLRELVARGYPRLWRDQQVWDLTAAGPPDVAPDEELLVVLDRLALRPEARARLVDSLEQAFANGGGRAAVQVMDGPLRRFGEGLACPRCARALERPRPLLFSFNHPLGACPECRGFGNVLRYDEQLVIPDPSRSVREGPVHPYNTPSHHWWQAELVRLARRARIRPDVPYARLTARERRLIWKGTTDLCGIDDFFEYHEGRRYRLHVRVMLSRYRSPSPCGSCGGRRLRPEALRVTVGGRDLAEVGRRNVDEAATFFRELILPEREQAVARLLLRQVRDILGFLQRVGLGYLTLDRETRSLSGGEAQRINLANQLATRLTGTLYVLDEPSIGLHPRDVARLAAIIRELAGAGNTVVLVEHDRSLIEAADHVVELGPGAGRQGGRVVFAGPLAEFRGRADSPTARVLAGHDPIPVPARRRPGSGRALVVRGARANNLQGIDVRIPLGTFTCVTGVSGSGKSTLVHDTLYRALARRFRVEPDPPGPFERLEGAEHLRGVRLIDQEPIGRTPRSNPVTYLKAFDPIRRLFAGVPEARGRRLGPGAFSFNVPGGRCEACEGAGAQRLEMQFFEDLFVRCPACEGRRYTPAVLQVRYRGKTIAEVLDLTVDEAAAFFADRPEVLRRLGVLQEVGLGYLALGQPATTLSGGEAQRLKIAAELGPRLPRETLYILDEPTTGLHVEDVRRLLAVLRRLVEGGNTVLVVEHHLDVIKTADHVIDLGPEAGAAGGRVVAAGTPEQVAATPGSHTGTFLREVLARAPCAGAGPMLS